jgi:hypothetical protein
MIFVNHLKNAKAAKDYYTQHIAPGDGRYYTEANAQQMKGVWHGSGAKMLQLTGEVRQEDFFKLCDNVNPVTGEKLTQRNREDRRVMTDLTFDAPKSVTLAYELGGHNGGGDSRVLTAFRESVRETMAEMESNVQTRVRKNGANADRFTGNLIWAEHVHRTTRPVTDPVKHEHVADYAKKEDKKPEAKPDPQLHAHATVLNATFDPIEKRWKAIQLGDIVRDKGYYQAAFHARLARKLKDLGYGIEKDGNSFRIAGIGKETADKFSRRTAVIDAEAVRLGITDKATKAQLGRRTREKKNEAPESMDDLRAEWDSRLTQQERLAIRTASGGWQKGDAEITPEQAKEYALEHAFQNASAVSEKRLRAEALTYAVGSVTPDAVADIAKHKEVIAEMRDGQLFATTKTVLADEVSMLEFARDGQRRQKPFLPSGSDGPGPDFSGLSEEQRQAALHVLKSRDTVTGVAGKAGTGKTTMMRATRDAIESVPGRHVFAFAPSSQASRGVLAKEGFKDAETLAMLLKNEKLQEKTKGQVLWVDEAGLVSSKDMRSLMELAKRNGNRVILSGDYTQHASVEAGDAFRLLEKEAGVRLARLKTTRRQTDPGYRKAVEAIAEGTGKSAQKGFDALDKMGWVVEAKGEERHKLLVNDYLNAFEEGKSALIIAPTHAEGQKLTDRLRSVLKERGGIGEEREFKVRRSTGWSDAQKGDIRNYEPGMVVEFHQNVKGFTRGDKAVVAEDESGLMLQKQDGTKAAIPLGNSDRYDVYRTHDIRIGKGDRIRNLKNDRKLGINNGDIYTVEGFTKEGDIRIEKGKLLPKSWGHFTLGYVDTSYASQGKTVKRVFIATGKESLPAANQQQWYVSASRGQEMAKVYVEDKQEVRDAIARTGQRLSAVELTHTKLRHSWRHRIRESIERSRVTRFLKERTRAAADRWRGREGVSYV